MSKGLILSKALAHARATDTLPTLMNHGKTCISVCAKTADELIERIKRAEDLADVIEIRFDCLNTNELDTALQKVDEIRCSKSFLATFRPKDVNAEVVFAYGAFEDKEQKQRIIESQNYRFSGWNKIIELENTEFLDFENDILLSLFISDSFGHSNHNSGFPFSIETCKKIKSKKIIASEHFFENIPSDLNEVYDNLKTEESDDLTTEVIKIAAQTTDITDTIPIWKLLERAKSENQQIIPIAMGESGKWTRILGLAHGAFMTYAALDTGQETAPGQVSARDLTEVYRAKNLNKETEVYGILGSNTRVSMSPYIHNAAFKHHNLNAVFVPLQVHDLDEFIKRMVKPETREVELNFKGFSVTIPHKQTIIKHLDFLDETAKNIGAVNTVKIVDGKLHGYNTDAQGFIEPLLNSYGDLRGAKVAVIGAGGAARACVYALKSQGARVTIFARDIAKAKNSAEEFEVELKELSTTNFSDFDVLVNTTPLGMKAKAEGETPATAEQLKGLHLVYDLVYIPFQTQLMNEADIAEIPKIGGLAMLIAQAMEQQKIWTGLDAPIKEMSRAALRKLM